MNPGELYDLKRLRQQAKDFCDAYDALVKLIAPDAPGAPNRTEVLAVSAAAQAMRDRLQSLAVAISHEKREHVSEHMRALSRRSRNR